MTRIGLFTLAISMITFFPRMMDAQDVHFTNNMIAPTYFNPAQTGAYTGTFRAGMILRDQWRPAANLPYTSGALFVDSPIIYGFNKQQWLGVGATLFYDRAGDVRQTWSGFYPGVAYHIGLDKKLRSIITVGLQYGFSNRGYDPLNAVTDWMLRGNMGDTDLERISGAGQGAGQGMNNDFAGSYSDLNIGVMYKTRPDKISKFEAGLAYMHVLNPGFNFNASTPPQDSTSATTPGRENNIGGRLNLHSVYRRALNRQMVLEPSAWVSLMPGATNINVQFRGEYLLKRGGDLSLIGGLGMRMGDAVQLLMGAHYKDYVFSFSYDHTISDHGGYNAAYELGVSRIFLVNKKPKVKPVIFCPRL